MGIKKNQLGTALGAAATPLALAEQAAPTAEANKIKLYSKDMLGVSEFFVQDDLGNEVQVTSGGAVNAGGGAMPFGTPIATPGTYPIQLNVINVVTNTGVTLTLPATPAPDARFGLVLGGVDVTLDPNGNQISNPVSFAFCASPITFDYGSTGCYLEFQFSSTLGGIWAVLSKGYYGSVLDLLDEGGSLSGNTQLLALDVTGAGASLSWCGGSRVATLNVPGGGGGGGQFPPVACTTGSGSIFVSSGCGYYFASGCAGTGNHTHLPTSPTNGDLIGVQARNSGGGFGMTGCGGHPIWLGASLCASHTIVDNNIYVWRYNSTTSQWDQVQG